MIHCPPPHSGVVSAEEEKMDANPLTVDQLKKYIGRKLDGIKELVDLYEAQLLPVMDIVPYLTAFHNDYDPFRHEFIIQQLRSKGSNKELVLVTSEQLSTKPCLYSYPLLLPLFDLSQPYNASWLGTTLVNSVFEGEVCEDCLKHPPQVSYYDALLTCLSYLDMSQCSKEIVSEFESIILHVVDNNRTAYLNDKPENELFYQILSRFGLSFPEIICNRLPTEVFDPASVIVCSAFTSRLPLVYNNSWLFSKVLPWMLILLQDIESFVECPDLGIIMSTTMYFTNQPFTIFRKNFNQLQELLDKLITIAINNTTEYNRHNASKSIRLLSMKLRAADQLRMIEQYISHENSSVSGLFIDLFSLLISQEGIDITHHGILKISRLLVHFNDQFDVLTIADKVLATLSLIQHIGLRQLSLVLSEMKQYIDQITECTRRKETEIVQQIEELKCSTPQGSGVLATIEVGGDVVNEPTSTEQLESLQLAKCRLDLIYYNLARARESLD